MSNLPKNPKPHMSPGKKLEKIIPLSEEVVVRIKNVVNENLKLMEEENRRKNEINFQYT
ncbi:MAG: hypothetical protein Q7S14_01620 [bacterium]|nr:hypothetical protein [bacterium]